MPGAPLVWADVPNNVAFDWEIGDKRASRRAVRAGGARDAADRGEQPHRRRLDGGARRARGIRRRRPDAGRCTPTPRAAGWSRTCWPARVQAPSREKFRVITPDVGGGFGMKLFLYAEHALICYAARKLGRPVKWTSRAERGVPRPTRRAATTSPLGEIAIDKDGKFLALRTAQLSPTWAPISPLSRRMIPTCAGTSVLASVYGFQAVHANVIGVFTNTVPVDAYRGAGRPESNYLVERLIDAAARELGIDRVELRRRNMVPPSAMPHTTPVGKIYDSGDFVRGAGCGAGEDGLDRLPGRRAAAGAPGQAARHRPGLLPGSDRRRPDRAGRDPLRRGRLRGCAMSAPSPPARGTRPPMSSSPPTELGIDGGEDPHPPGRHGHDPDGRRHRRRAQPLFGGPGDPRSPPRRVIEKGKQAASEALEAAVADIAFDGRPLLHRRHRPRHRHPRPRGDAAPEGGAGRGGDDCSTPPRSPTIDVAHLPERLPHGRGRGRPGYRHDRGRPLRGVRRRRQGGEPDDRARPGAWRRGAGHRPGGARAHRLRPGMRPAAVRQLHGLRPAARRRPAGHRGRVHRGALRDQSARREGRGRGRRGRQPAGA